MPGGVYLNTTICRANREIFGVIQSKTIPRPSTARYVIGESWRQVKGRPENIAIAEFTNAFFNFLIGKSEFMRLGVSLPALPNASPN
jgi:hypothetical protein